MLVAMYIAAKTLGLDESPPPYRIWNRNDEDFNGVNFAVAHSRVLRQGSLPLLSQQINQLSRVVDAKDIGDSDLEDSGALVAISGNEDYQSVNEMTDIRALSEDVTDEIVASVRKLQRLGVTKVLVNSLPPLGCQPWRSLNDDGVYTSCDITGNLISETHNTVLRQKLSKLRRGSVLVLDLFSVFNNLISEDGNNLAPCCDTPNNVYGYCGQVDARGRRAYNLCPNPGTFFYWDYVHPTQATWNAVMQILEDPIKDFLASSN